MKPHPMQLCGQSSIYMMTIHKCCKRLRWDCGLNRHFSERARGNLKKRPSTQKGLTLRWFIFERYPKVGRFWFGTGLFTWTLRPEPKAKMSHEMIWQGGTMR
ncbi:hypothetical protein QQP08_005006 [Theobroma cacao]|nr:hypothetical protein QQP08_005006 [Theobroma cacao]